MAPRTPARILSVGGGKGGVGKSVVAANLAVALAERRLRVVLVDGDLGTPNLHTMFGIERPGPSLQGLLDHSIAHLGEAVIATGVTGLGLVPGGATFGAANLGHAQKLRLCNQIRGLEADVIVIDVGAGVSFNTLDLFDLGTIKLVVTSPQLTAIQNAYSFLKGAVVRALRRRAADAEEAALLDEELPRGETERVPGLIQRVRAQRPELAVRLETTLAHFGARLVGNQLFAAGEQNVFHAVSRLVADFLGVSAPLVGVLHNQRVIHDSVNRRRPLLLGAGGGDSAATLRAIAAQLLMESAPAAAPAAARTRPSPASPAATSSAAPREADAGRGFHRALGSFERRHERFAVSWPGGAGTASGEFALRVMEISLGGALLETGGHPLALDEQLTLTFTNLDGAPALPVVVRNLRDGGRLAGVQFLAVGDLPAALAAAIGVLRAPARCAASA